LLKKDDAALAGGIPYIAISFSINYLFCLSAIT
jgi:hypothetical protein